MIRAILVLLTLSLTGILAPACEKEPQIIRETVVETDTLYVVTTDTIVQHITDTVALTTWAPDTATVFILARHAETTGAGSDPFLSAEGQLRAEELARVLQNVPLAAVYSTNYNRTRLTAQPTATAQNLSLQLYAPSEQAALLATLKEQYAGQTVLLLGHSNTVPQMLNLLTQSNAWSTLSDTQYDNLFVVTVFKASPAKVLHLKYGKPS
ncbi:MAG: histidine phosphatase family protein [Saprospiraceae bacterium]|nr:histidine phosphatase family protein [Saprospiraceae bacterium]